MSGSATRYRVWGGGLAAVLLLWEVAARGGWISPIILPSIADVVRALVTDWPRFAAGLTVTLQEIGLALAISWILGVGFGLFAGTRPLLRAVSGPVLAAVFAVPLVILYPLFVAWLGLGMSSKVLFGVIAGVIPIALNTLSGVARIDPRYAVMARAMGASPAQVFLRVTCRLAVPAILSGLRIGTALVVIYVLVTEMLASLAGIGYLVSYHRTLFDTGHVYLGMLIGLVLVLLVNAGLAALERRLGHWRDLQGEALVMADRSREG